MFCFQGFLKPIFSFSACLWLCRFQLALLLVSLQIVRFLLVLIKIIGFIIFNTILIIGYWIIERYNIKDFVNQLNKKGKPSSHSDCFSSLIIFFLKHIPIIASESFLFHSYFQLILFLVALNERQMLHSTYKAFLVCITLESKYCILIFSVESVALFVENV